MMWLSINELASVIHQLNKYQGIHSWEDRVKKTLKIDILSNAIRGDQTYQPQNNENVWDLEQVNFGLMKHVRVYVIYEQ